MLKTSPKAESFVDTPEGRGTVVDVNLLRQCVKVRMEDQPETVGCFHNCDICVLRNGKAKKNDPPIPADLAPISRKRQTDEAGHGGRRASYAFGSHPFPLPSRRHCAGSGGSVPSGGAPAAEENRPKAGSSLVPGFRGRPGRRRSPKPTGSPGAAKPSAAPSRRLRMPPSPSQLKSLAPRSSAWRTGRRSSTPCRRWEISPNAPASAADPAPVPNGPGKTVRSAEPKINPNPLMQPPQTMRVSSFGRSFAFLPEAPASHPRPLLAIPLAPPFPSQIFQIPFPRTPGKNLRFTK